MDLNTHDLHLMLSGSARTGKLYAAGGILLDEFEARNRTVNNGTFARWGNCPAGTFMLGEVILKGTPPFGRFFIPMLDFGDNHAMADNHRSGIGIHGGGSGLADPFRGRQGWVITHGCFRMQNEDLDQLVHLVRAAQGVGGKCYASVLPWSPTEVVDPWEPDIIREESDLDPDE